MKLTPETRMGKEQFLIEHNKLSPKKLQATLAMVTSFQQEKKPNLKDNEWSSKLRQPFILWLLSLQSASSTEKEQSEKPAKQEYKIYPEME